MIKSYSLTRPMQFNREYLLICLLRPEMTSIQAIDLANSLIGQFEGKVISQESYNYPLAYKINKSERAHYVVSKILICKENIRMLRKRIGENEQFLRAMITKDLKMDITESSAKYYSSNTTKRGRIFIQKKLNRKNKSQLSKQIKTRRSIGLMRCCNYYYTQTQ